MYVRAPPGFPQGKDLVLLLLKAVYGLKQAAEAWYDTLARSLKSQGWRVSQYDPCLFIHDTMKLFLVV